MCNENMNTKNLWRELSDDAVLDQLKSQSLPGIRLVYSTYFGGFTRNPAWALVPFHDHIVHRGDGVFEALKVKNRKIYLLNEHLNRLFHSAEKIGLKVPINQQDLYAICRSAVQESQLQDAYVRIFVSRGPGGFGVSPFESTQSQVFVFVLDYAGVPAVKYSAGVKVCRSSLAPKKGWMAQVKSCNYLVNVLMKKEALEKGFEFGIGFDEEGWVTESSTENFMGYRERDGFLVPHLQNTLRGTTLMRFLSLSQELLGIPHRYVNLSEQDVGLLEACYLVGTTLGVLPVAQFDSVQFRVHPRASEFNALIEKDLENGA